IAVAGERGEWHSRTQAYVYSNWTVYSKREEDQKLLAKAGVAEGTAALANGNGNVVGRIAFSGAVKELIFFNTAVGQVALQDVFLFNKKDFAKDGAHESVDVGLTSSSGKAIVF